MRRLVIPSAQQEKVLMETPNDGLVSHGDAELVGDTAAAGVPGRVLLDLWSVTMQARLTRSGP